jgi:peroxiredoxin-like protein
MQAPAETPITFITLAAMMERNMLDKEDLTMESEGIVDVTNGVITYKTIIHRPHIVLKPSATEQQYAFTLKLAEKTETSCMISRAVQGNIEIKLDSIIEVASR